MPPYSERVSEPFNEKRLTEELPRQQGGQPEGDTPSPRTPSTSSSISPPPTLVSSQAATALIPILAEDGIPHDHTLPHFIRQITGEPTLDDIQNMTLRVLTATSSLQQMSLYTPNLRELNLEGSAISSLRDIGCELRLLEVLRVGRCRLSNLNGTLGLPKLRELHASHNLITNAAPCAHLSNLRLLDLARNQLNDERSLGFLSTCHHLEILRLEGNPVSSQPSLQNYLHSILPSLQTLDNVLISPLANNYFDGVQETIVERDESYMFNDNNERPHLSEPGPSNGSSVSRLTSGQILCGNITTNRRKLSATQCIKIKEVNIMRWRNAFIKIRNIRRKEKK